MGGAFFAELIGALIAVLIVSRLIRRFAMKNSKGWQRVIAPTGVSLAVATVLAAFGNADGGSPQFLAAFILYGSASLIVFAIDAGGFVRSRRSDEDES